MRKLLTEINHFLQSPVAVQALGGLSSAAQIQVYIGSNKFFLRKQGEVLILSPESASDSTEFSFWIPESTIQKLLSEAKAENLGVGSLGIRVLQFIFSANAAQKIKFSVHATLFTLLRRGYFSVLLAGGPEIMLFLAKHGFGSMGKVKDALSRGGSGDKQSSEKRG